MMILIGMAVYCLMFLKFLIPVQLMHYLSLKIVLDTAAVALDETLTCPEPANWTFSQDFPNLSYISISSIGMDTKQACLGTNFCSEHVRHYSIAELLHDIARVYFAKCPS